MALFNKDWNTYKTNWQNANGIGGKIGSIFASSNANTSASVISNDQVQILRNWNNAVKHGCTDQATFNRIIANADENTKMYFAGLNKGKGSIEGLKNAQKVSTQSTIGLTIAQTALNMAITMGITALASLIMKGYDELANSVENCKERVDDLMSSYKSALDTADNNANRVEELADKYEDLSKGVNSLGENVSLTNEEYEEYNSLVNEIAEMFPTLVQGYTDEGNAILNLKGNVEQLRDAYKEAQREAYNLLIVSGEDSDGNDIIKQWEDTHDTGFWSDMLDLGADDVGGGIAVSDALEQLKAIQKMSADEYREIERITGSGSRKEIAGLTDIEKEIGYGSYLYKALGLDSGVTDEEFREAQRQAKALVQSYNAEIESALSDVETLANAYLMTNEDYDKLDAQSKSAASMIVNSLNADIANGFSSKEDVATYVDGIVQAILSNSKAEGALTDLFTMDTSDMYISEIESQVDSYIDTIANALNEDPVELKTRLGFDNSDTEPLVNKVKGFLSDEFDDKVGELTLDELDIASELEIPDGTLLSWDELIVKIKEVQSSTLDNKIDDPFNPSTFSESISALSQLQATYDDFYNDVVDKSDFTFDISDIEKLREVFGSTGEVFEEFEKLATSSSTSVDELQKSFDGVLNAFITSNNMLDGLNSSTRDQIVSQLELQGVMNASEIITDEVALVIGKAAESNMTLANAADEAYISLLDEVNASDQTRSAIYSLASAEIMYNNSGLDVSGKIEALQNLAKAYNDTATEALLANAAMSAMSYARNTAAKPYMTGTEYEAEYEKAYSSKMNEILDDAYASMQKFSNSTFKLDQSASNAAKTQDRLAKATDKATDAIKEQTKALEEEKQALEEQKNTMDKLASAISAFYDKKIDKLNDEKDAIEDNIQAWEDLTDAINWFLELKTDELDKFIDKLNDANDALQDELDNMDNILSVVDSVYQEEIDLIQAKIDALDEANDAKEKEIALEEARIALEEARNRKSVMLFQKGLGFTYHVDNKAIKEAESNLADLEAEAESDAIKNALQDQIDKLQEYRDMWSEIPDAYKKAMDELEAMQMFGTDYKSAILNSNEGTINEFKGQYTGTQSEMASNDNQISALEAQKKQIEEIMDFWESATNKWEEDQNRMKLSAFFGSDYETSIMSQSIDKWNEYVTQYANAQQKLSDVEAQIASLERLKSEWEDAANAYEDSQNRALLASFFGSDYDYQLLNNSSVWRQKFVSDYANICDQIAEKEAEISALSESTASNVSTSAGQASDALGGTSNTLRGLHQTAESGNSISKYIWGDDDDFLLTSAQSRLIELNRLVGDDMSGTMVDMRDKVKAFVDEYSNLEQTGVVTNELKDSLDALSSSEDYAWGYFGTILDGLATRIGDVSNYTTEVIANTQMISDSMATLDTALQSVQSSEKGAEKEAVDTVSDVNTTITTALDNISKLNAALSELETSRSNLEGIVTKAEEDTNSIASESYNRILLIRDAMSELVMALTSVELSFMSLIGKMQLLDATTLSNVIAQVGFFDDGTSLCGAVHAVINTINNDLINTALPLLNAQNTDTISTEFNGEADSLLSAIKDVTNALYSEDENCLYARINKLTETISRVKQVESAFADLEKQVISTFDEVTRLDSKIQSMKDKTITITTRYVTEGKATGTAFTGKGYASGTAFSGKSYLSGSWGLKQDQPKSMIAEIAPEILLRNGEYRLIKEPQMIDLKKGDIVFNHEQTKAILDRGKTSNINRLSKLGFEAVKDVTLKGQSFLLGTANNPFEGMENLLKYTPYTLNIPNINHNFQHLDYVKRDTGKKVEISIGDIVVQGVQDTNSLSKAIVRQLPNKILQEIGKL